MKCYFCGGEMIMSSISSKDELGLDGEGSVIIFTCNNTKCNSDCEFIEGEKELNIV